MRNVSQLSLSDVELALVSAMMMLAAEAMAREIEVAPELQSKIHPHAVVAADVMNRLKLLVDARFDNAH